MGDQKNNALKKIFAGGSIIFLSVLVAKVLALGYRLITGRFLGPEEYGVLTLMMAIYSTVTTLAFLNIEEGVQKYVSQYRGTGNYPKIKGTIHSGLFMLLFVSTVVGTSLFLLSEYIALNIFGQKLAIWPIRFVAISLPFLGAMQLLTNVAEGYENMKPTAYTGQIGVNLIKFVLTAFLVALGYGYLGAAFAFSFSIIAASFLAVYFYRKIIPKEVVKSKASYNFKEIIVFSGPLLAAGVFGIFSNQIDTYMLQYFLGSSEVGLYNAAYPIAMIVTISDNFSSIFMSAASRLKAEGNKEVNAELFRAVTKWISALGVPIFLILFLFPETALILFGKEYYGAAGALRILSIGFLANALSSPIVNIYQAYDRTELNFVTTVILASSNISLNYIFIAIMELGINGAAIATTTSFLITGVFNIYMSYKFLGKSPFKKSMIMMLIFAVISISVPYLISNLLFKITPAWFLIFNLIIFGALYTLLTGFTGILEKEDKMIIEGVLRKTGLDEKYADYLKYSG